MLDGFGLAPVCLELDLDSYDGPWTHVHRFRGRSGWLVVAEAVLDSEQDSLTTTLVAACDDRGQPVPGFMVPNLLACACSHPAECSEEPPEVLDDLLCEEEGALIVRWRRESNHALAEIGENADGRIAQLEGWTRAQVNMVERQIADLRRRRRMPGLTLEARSIFDTIIAELDARCDDFQLTLAEQRTLIRADAAADEEKLITDEEILLEVTPLYYVNWQDRSGMKDADYWLLPENRSALISGKTAPAVHNRELGGMVRRSEAGIRSKLARSQPALDAWERERALLADLLRSLRKVPKQQRNRQEIIIANRRIGEIDRSVRQLEYKARR